MVKFWIKRIKDGKNTIDEVPSKLREAVKEVLEQEESKWDKFLIQKNQ